MSVLETAINSVQQTRQQRISSLARQQLQRDNKSVRVATFAGYRNGQAIARYPNGGEVPIDPISNGAIARGQLITLNMRGRGTPQASWMPR